MPSSQLPPGYEPRHGGSDNIIELANFRRRAARVQAGLQDRIRGFKTNLDANADLAGKEFAASRAALVMMAGEMIQRPPHSPQMEGSVAAGADVEQLALRCAIVEAMTVQHQHLRLQLTSLLDQMSSIARRRSWPA